MSTDDKKKAAAKPKDKAKEGKPAEAKAKEKKPKKEAEAAGAEAAAPAAKPAEKPRPPADPRLKVLKKFRGRFLPKGPLRDRLKALHRQFHPRGQRSEVRDPNSEEDRGRD